MVFKKFLIIFSVVLFALLNITLLFTLLLRTESLNEQIESAAEITIDTIGAIDSALIKTSDEINILREMVNLPPSSYISLDTEDDTSSENDKESVRVKGYNVYYNAFETLYNQHADISKKQFLDKYLTEQKEVLQKLGITYSTGAEKKVDASFVLLKGNNIWYFVKFNEEKNIPAISPFPFEEYIDISDEKDFEPTISKTKDNIALSIAKNSDNIKKLKNFMASTELRNLLTKKNVRIVPASKHADTLFTNILYNISASNAPPNNYLATLSYSNLESSFYMDNQKYDSFEKIKIALEEIDKKIDFRTTEEKLISIASMEIQKMADDPSFKMYLESKGYYLSVAPREDADYVYFDILSVSENSKSIGSFSVNKFTGIIYITDFEEIQLSALATISAGFSGAEMSKKKK